MARLSFQLAVFDLPDTINLGSDVNVIKQSIAGIWLLLFALQGVAAQGQPERPGLKPYVPTRIEWLALMVESTVRQPMTAESLFTLNVAYSDHETIVILVRHMPNVNRSIMNASIDAARRVTEITAKSYGWDSWVKIREQVESTEP